VPLYLADMTSFTLSTRFDAIVCAYQGVNHLLSLSAWQSFFGCAYRHLNPGGMLVFDIATVRYLMTMASIPKVVEQFGDNYLQITVSTTDGARFRWHIDVFELQRDGRYGCSPSRRDAIVPRRSGYRGAVPSLHRHRSHRR
jgi:cyclopropane fatty-acyl-phospholipid synthase-like methyltransferase